MAYSSIRSLRLRFMSWASCAAAANGMHHIYAHYQVPELSALIISDNRKFFDQEETNTHHDILQDIDLHARHGAHSDSCPADAVDGVGCGNSVVHL